MGSICTYLSSHIASFFSSGSARSIAVKKNIVGSLLLKCISILISLQVVPLTIDYVNPTRYVFGLQSVPLLLGSLILI